MTDNFLDYELDEYKNEAADLKKKELEENKSALIATLDPLVKKLREANLKKSDAEVALSAIKLEVMEIENEIRKIWGPYIEGVDKASIDVDGSRLESSVVLNVKTIDDSYLDWMSDNGYKDVMKWQVHHMTLKRIANDLYAQGQQIPGIEYSTFNKIKLK